MVGGIRDVVPNHEPQQIVALAFTDVVKHGPLTPSRMNEMIPFLGYLIGMAYLGHSVVVFEGHPSALAAGCRDADIVFVDEGMLAYLQPDWLRVVQGAMWRPDVRIVRCNSGMISFVGM
jgi:hypothetical protein